MTPYYLNSDELNMLLQFNGLLQVGYSFTPLTYDNGSNLYHFNTHIFDKLLVMQPGLQQDYEIFKEKVINPSWDENYFFTEIFDGKIMLHCAVDALFNEHKNYNAGNEKRFNTFKSIFKKYPEFFNITHDYLKNSHDKDDVIFDIYFTMLKSPYAKKSGVAQSEIITLVDTYNYHEKYGGAVNVERLKIKLIAYLSLPKKDMHLYQHIMQTVGADINKNAVIANLFESKIKNFDSDVIKQYYNDKIQFVPYEENEAYYYSFKTTANYIISKSDVANKTAQDFLLVFHAAITGILTTDFNAIGKSGDGVLFKTQEDRAKAKEFCQLIGDDLPSLFNDKIFKNSYNNNITLIQEYARDYYAKYTLKNSLENELPINATPNKMRNKI